MKQVIYSTGVFETELTVLEPEDVEHHVKGLWITRPLQQKFKVNKTSCCLMRYELEDGDAEYLQQLQKAADKATRALSMNLISASECKLIVDRCNDFSDLYNQAVYHFESECEGMTYVEIADESSRGCYAKYHFRDGVAKGCYPCKIGEPLTIKIDKPLII